MSTRIEVMARAACDATASSEAHCADPCNLANAEGGGECSVCLTQAHAAYDALIAHVREEAGELDRDLKYCEQLEAHMDEGGKVGPHNARDLIHMPRQAADALALLGQEWQPIDTAPRDGTEILGLIGDGRVRVVMWGKLSFGDYDWCYADGGVCSEFNIKNRPTHYMPLPEPPKPEGNEG